jgi:hypothetical protein
MIETKVATYLQQKLPMQVWRGWEWFGRAGRDGELRAVAEKVGGALSLWSWAEFG